MFNLNALFGEVIALPFNLYKNSKDLFGKFIISIFGTNAFILGFIFCAILVLEAKSSQP